MDESDLLALASRGRVKFHEADEFVCWQNGAYTALVFVIQQGAASLWEDVQGKEILRDVRGPGDIIGVERFVGSKVSPYSARANGDVVIYALPAADLEPLIEKYPQARRYVDGYSAAGAVYQHPGREGVHERFVLELAGHSAPVSCDPGSTIAGAARLMQAAGSDLLAVVRDGKWKGAFTAHHLVAWAAGGAPARSTVQDVMDASPPVVQSHATVTDCVLAMSEAGASTVAVTSDGSRAGALLHLVNAPDLQQAFGDNPLTILNEIARASDRDALRRLHLRARAFVLAQLTEPSTVDWLARFAERINVAIGRRLSALAGDVHADWSWCFYGAAGRCEALSAVQPSMTIICSDEADVPNALNALDRLRSGLLECGYLPVEGSSNISPCAAVSTWDERFTKWVRDPIGTQMHRALPLFDLRAAWGNAELVQQVAGVVRDAIGNDPLFGKLVAVDCLSSLPPLTFFQDAVLDESGESSGVFELESRALGPIVEVGRAFGIANGAVLSTSTLDRLDTARLRNPTGDAIFREAAETLRVLLFLQARTGLRLQNTGGEILPAQLSRFDRQALKSGFRAIHNLLEFTFQRLWKDAS